MELMKTTGHFEGFLSQEVSKRGMAEPLVGVLSRGSEWLGGLGLPGDRQYLPGDSFLKYFWPAQLRASLDPGG